MKEPKKPSWDKLPQEERRLYLTLLWEDDYTEQAIADFLGTTKGTIVGRRRLWQISKEDRGTPKNPVNPERFRDLLDLHKMEKVENENGGNVVCIAPPESTEADAPAPVAERTSEQPVEDPKVVPMIAPVKRERKPVERTEELPPVLPKKEEKQVERPTCQWPLASGGSLKEPAVCGEPCVPGEDLCEVHKKQIRPTFRQG